MREIKFRGKHAGVPRGWIYGYLVVEHGHWYIINDEGKFPVIPETVGQYIELNDIHNRGIYEGDILKLTKSDGNIFGMGVVKYADAQFYVETSSRANVDFFALKLLGALYEIIGNIYDNPELLEVKE